jgi:hypothetical protein
MVSITGLEFMGAIFHRLKADGVPDKIPIVQLGATGQWDKSCVEKRTERICDILWERIYEWLA